MKTVEKRIEESISDAERAVERYGRGELSETEKSAKCDVKILLENWTKTLASRRQRLADYRNKLLNS